MDEAPRSPQAVSNRGLRKFRGLINVGRIRHADIAPAKSFFQPACLTTAAI